jgi:hypothetical protein
VEFEKTRADDYRPGCLYLISCWYPRFQVQKRFLTLPLSMKPIFKIRETKRV